MCQVDAGCSELVLSEERAKIFEEESIRVQNHLKNHFTTGANYVIPLTLEPELSNIAALEKAYKIESLIGKNFKL